MRITEARILGGGPPRSRRNSHPSPAPTPPDRLGFTKPLTSTLVVNHGFALTHTNDQPQMPSVAAGFIPRFSDMSASARCCFLPRELASTHLGARALRRR